MNWLGLLLLIYLAGSLLDRVLSWLNMRHHQRELPAELAPYMDAEAYAKAYEYHRTNFRFGLLKSSISIVFTTLLLAMGAFGWLDGQLRGITEDPIGLPLLYFATLFILSDVLSLPFAWYQTFTIEERFGFNKTTPKTFWLDKLKGYALALVFGGLVMGVLLWLVNELGADFWLWFWLFISLFTLFMNVFYTSLLLPLFNKLTPLEAGELRQKIEAYSAGVKFPLDNILVMDGSRRSAKANAFFSGLGKQKKVVLFDTLVEKHSQEELVAVLAHEVGHYKKRHIILGYFFSVLQTGLVLFLLSRFILSPELSFALGAETYGIHLNLMAFGILYSPISLVIGLLMNLLSRKNEFEADAYAADTYDAAPLREALIRLHTDSLANLTPHPWFVFFHYSHPPLLSRLAALRSTAISPA
ncbi:MAG: M48 family metallopeptidase [Bacteroidota bacterium]